MSKWLPARNFGSPPVSFLLSLAEKGKGTIYPFPRLLIYSVGLCSLTRDIPPLPLSITKLVFAVKQRPRSQPPASHPLRNVFAALQYLYSAKLGMASIGAIESVDRLKGPLYYSFVPACRNNSASSPLGLAHTSSTYHER